MPLSNRGAGKAWISLPRSGREIESVAAQIIPKDDTPGAREAGRLFHRSSLTTSTRTSRRHTRKGSKNLRAKTHELFPDADKFSGLNPANRFSSDGNGETAFFGQVRVHTIVGFFANPEYGGTRKRSAGTDWL